MKILKALFLLFVVNLLLISCLNGSRKRPRIPSARSSSEIIEASAIPRDATGHFAFKGRLEIQQEERKLIHEIEHEKIFNEWTGKGVIFSSSLTVFSMLTQCFLDATDPTLPYLKELTTIAACCVLAGSYIIKDSYDRIRYMNKELSLLKK